MLFLVIFLTSFLCYISAQVSSPTELAKNCSLFNNSIYFRGSCYIKTTKANYHLSEDPECNHITNARNYPGHAAFILDEETAETVGKAILPNVYAYIAAKGTGGIYRWTHPDGRSWPVADDFKQRLFDPNQAIAGGVARVSLLTNGKLHDWDQTWYWLPLLHAYICQYREKDLCFIKAADNKKGSNMAMVDGPIDADGTDCAQYCLKTPVCQSFSHDEEKCIMYTYMSGGMEFQDAQGFMLCEKP